MEEWMNVKSVNYEAKERTDGLIGYTQWIGKQTNKTNKRTWKWSLNEQMDGWLDRLTDRFVN